MPIICHAIDARKQLECHPAHDERETNGARGFGSHSNSIGTGIQHSAAALAVAAEKALSPNARAAALGAVSVSGPSVVMGVFMRARERVSEKHTFT